MVRNFGINTLNLPKYLLVIILVEWAPWVKWNLLGYMTFLLWFWKRSSIKHLGYLSLDLWEPIPIPGVTMTLGLRTLRWRSSWSQSMLLLTQQMRRQRDKTMNYSLSKERQNQIFNRVFRHTQWGHYKLIITHCGSGSSLLLYCTIYELDNNEKKIIMTTRTHYSL